MILHIYCGAIAYPSTLMTKPPAKYNGTLIRPRLMRSATSILAATPSVGRKWPYGFQPRVEARRERKVVSAAFEKIAKEVGAKYIISVAIAYIMQKAPYVFSIIGCRKVERLQANLEALGIVLTAHQVALFRSTLVSRPRRSSVFSRLFAVYRVWLTRRSNLLFVRFCRKNPEFEMGL